jgi:uncharacterized protein (TIGR00297 family)
VIVSRTARRLWWAAALSGGMGIAARWRGALTTSGALGALFTGTGIAGAGGWDWGVALVYFFVSSSVLSRLATARKMAVAADKFAKGSQRDLTQALANGGVGTAMALLRASPWGARHTLLLENAFAGAVATANADTWGTEIGTLSRQPPRLITTGRRVTPGTSGGVTPLGLAASAAGAATLGVAFAVARAAVPRAMRAPLAPSDTSSLLRAALAGGVAGSVCDSVLGATLQAMYRCQACGSETERRRHACGASTLYLRGVPWLDNDGVNALSTLAGALVGATAGRRIGRRG